MIWEGNLDYIEKHNLAADRGDYSFWLGMNEYGDMVSESRDLVNTGLQFLAWYERIRRRLLEWPKGKL